MCQRVNRYRRFDVSSGQSMEFADDSTKKVEGHCRICDWSHVSSILFTEQYCNAAVQKLNEHSACAGGLVRLIYVAQRAQSSDGTYTGGFLSLFSYVNGFCPAKSFQTPLIEYHDANRLSKCYRNQPRNHYSLLDSYAAVGTEISKTVPLQVVFPHSEKPTT